MERTVPKYNDSGSKIIGEKKVKVIAQVKYIGDDVLSFDNGKIYDIIDYRGRMIRLIDESEEDYLYDFFEPNMNNEGKIGRFEIYKDFTEDENFTKEIKKAQIES